MKDHKINSNIRAKFVTLIINDRPESKVRIEDALSRASNEKMDLVQMNDGDEPICKIMNYGK